MISLDLVCPDCTTKRPIHYMKNSRTWICQACNWCEKACTTIGQVAASMIKDDDEKSSNS